MENFSKDKLNKLGFIKSFASNDIKHRKNKCFKNHHQRVERLLLVTKAFDLAQVMGCSFDLMQALILEPTYVEFAIPKKDHSLRKIQAPHAELRSIQSKLNDLLQIYYYYWVKPNFVHGFVIRPKGESKICNIVSNAQSHAGKKYVLNIDLQDFFTSITSRRVYELFLSTMFGFNENIAKSLTFLTTYKGFLPTGAPTSPVISNFICVSLDCELHSFCEEQQITFSRYADDLTFSSSLELGNEQIDKIKEIIHSHQLVVNHRKVYIKKNNKKQSVTGLIVNEKVNVDRKLLKKVRAMIHSLKTKGLEESARFHFMDRHINGKNINEYFLNQLGGYINFIGQVRGKGDGMYLKYKNDYNLFIES